VKLEGGKARSARKNRRIAEGCGYKFYWGKNSFYKPRKQRGGKEHLRKRVEELVSNSWGFVGYRPLNAVLLLLSGKKGATNTLAVGGGKGEGEKKTKGPCEGGCPKGKSLMR